MGEYFIKLIIKKSVCAVGSSFIIWVLLLSFMATDPLPKTSKPGVFEMINLAVPRLGSVEAGEEGRRRYLMLPVG